MVGIDHGEKGYGGGTMFAYLSSGRLMQAEAQKQA